MIDFLILIFLFFFFSSRRRHTRFDCDWSSDVCSSDLLPQRFTLRGREYVVAEVLERWKTSTPDRGEMYLRRHWFRVRTTDRKSTRLNSSHSQISYAVFCLKKKKKKKIQKTQANKKQNK